MNLKIRQWGGFGIYFVTVFILGTVVLGSFFRVGINGNPPTMFRDMVDGTAHKPFVYRALAPAVIRVIERAIPDTIQSRIRDVALHGSVSALFEYYHWEQKDAVAYVVTAGLLYLCLCLFVHAFGMLARTQYHLPVWFLRALSVVALAGLPCFFRYYSYLYDFPHLMLFCYALALMYREKWYYYFGLFFLTCLSKETAVLLPMVYILYFRSEWRTAFFKLAVGIHGLIFVGVKLGLFLAFRENPGGSLEFHLGHNLTLLPYSFAQLGMWVFMVVLCAWRWYEKPIFLRDAVWMLLPLFGLTFWFGLLDEYRDYYEVYPVILLLMVPAVAEFLRVPVSCKNK